METLTEKIKSTGLSLPPISEAYKEIQLSEDEKNQAIEEALFQARRKKHAEITSAKYLEEINKKEVPKQYTVAQLFSFLEAKQDFVIDSDNEIIVRLLCQYFTNDKAFEQSGYSLQKGILLFGGVGVGKTLLMELFRNNQKESYQVVTCQDVEGVYAKNGPDMNERTNEMGLRKYFGLINLNSPNAYGQRSLGYLFDDLGQEIINTKYFGTERNVMQEVLTQRYKNQLFSSTHITTNLSGEQIKEMYGVRVSDRMREMFNIIPFEKEAKSRRK